VIFPRAAFVRPDAVAAGATAPAIAAPGRAVS
jgi:hypothetical protein